MGDDVAAALGRPFVADTVKHMTKTHIHDLFDPEQFASAVAEGYVRVADHPDDPRLHIANYSASAQYERMWNDVTRACRGLIYDDDGVVLARPFGKFFNLTEPDAGPVPIGEPFVATDKLDGSLGICYQIDGRAHIATRGSFVSEQAVHADKLLAESGFVPPEGETWLFEIIYPGNRIVVDYGTRDELVLIARIDIATGADLSLDDAKAYGWHGGVTKTYDAASIAELQTLLEAANGLTREGFVLCWPRPSRPSVRLKLKAADYMRLHKLFTGMNLRDLWTAAAVDACRDIEPRRLAAVLHIAVDDINERSIDELIAEFPDEMYATVRAHVTGWQEAVDKLGAQCAAYLDTLSAEGVTTRKEAAARIKTSGIAPALLFAALDGSDIRPMLWRTVKPEALPIASE